MELNIDQVIYCLEQDIESGCGMYREVDVTDLKRALALIKELAEENKRLGIDNFDLICELSRIKENTVREMQERIKAQMFTHKNFGDLVYVDDIDQIEKEMLGGK